MTTSAWALLSALLLGVTAQVLLARWLARPRPRHARRPSWRRLADRFAREQLTVTITADTSALDRELARIGNLFVAVDPSRAGDDGLVAGRRVGRSYHLLDDAQRLTWADLERQVAAYRGEPVFGFELAAARQEARQIVRDGLRAAFPDLDVDSPRRPRIAAVDDLPTPSPAVDAALYAFGGYDVGARTYWPAPPARPWLYPTC